MSTTDWYKHATCPIPDNEKERLGALARFESLVEAPEEEFTFDRLVRLGTRLCGLPIGFMNLITADKQYAKAAVGHSREESLRSDSFCQYTIMQDDVFEVEDTHLDPLFRFNPNVHSEMNLRYYAGVPLKTHDGHNIGSLCLIGHKPSKLNEEQKDSLRTLADEIVSQYELKLAKAQLEKEHKQKDELIRIVSHDLRNPLMGIAGFAEYLCDDVDNEEHRNMLTIIKESSHSISRIINILLNTDYIKNNAFKLNLTTTDAAELTREVIQLFTPYAMLKKHKLDTQIPETLMWRIDGEKWKQITGNLVNNAAKFTPDGGTITIILSHSDDQENLQFEVSDTGIGMTPAIQKDLFSGSTRIQRNGTGGEASSGVGMMLIRKFTDLHGGEIHVESEPGQGCRILVSIPA